MKLIVSTAALALALAGPAISSTPAVAQDLKTNRVTVDYLEPRDPKLQGVYERMKQRQVLEEFSRFLAPLRLPTTLRVWAFQCDTVNAYYKPDYRAIHMCYEYLDDLEKNAPQTVSPEGFTRAEALIGGFVSVLLHETGHALYDLLNVPVFGREEDAADQIAGFIGLQFGKDVSKLVTRGAASIWLAEARGALVPPSYSDEHSTGGERFYNYLCLGYGGDPDTFQDLIAKGWLPKSRAANCADEYQQVKQAFSKTILPFIDPDMMQKARATQWFRPDELK
jgi:hypothetical protein